MNPLLLLILGADWFELLYRLNLLYPLLTIFVINFNDIVVVVIQTLCFHTPFLLSIIIKKIIYNVQVCYINCFKNRIKSFSINNTSDRFSGIVLLEINRLFVILLGCDINNKVAMGVFITGITSKNNGLVDEFSVLNCNYIFK